MSSSSPTSDTVTFTDDDVDGVMAGKVIHYYYKQRYPKSTHTVLFQKWDRFGVYDEDVEKILSYNPRTVHILDVGSDSTVLMQVSKLLVKNINVVVYDNHPPDMEDDPAFPEALMSIKEKYPFPPKEAYPYPFFIYDSSKETCTTGIAFEHVKQSGINLEAMERWTLMGLRGDVAFKDGRGKVLYENLMAKYPYLGGLLMSIELGDGYDKSILEFFTQLFHVPRRIIFDDAPPLCFKAIDEMNLIPNWIEFYRKIDEALAQKGTFTNPVDAKDSPNLAKIVDLYHQWREEFKNYWDAGVALEYSGYGVTVLKSPWNLGSALSNVKSSRNKKPHFVINVIERLKKGITKEEVLAGKNINTYDVHISGRSSDEARLHIGKVFRATNPAIMSGGGLKQAGSARVDAVFTDISQINTETLLNELVRAANKTLNTKG